MLANNLTLDDEEAVQEEFRQLQALKASFLSVSVVVFPLTHLQALEAGPEQVIKLPDVPDTKPVRVETPGTITFHCFA